MSAFVPAAMEVMTLPVAGHNVSQPSIMKQKGRHGLTILDKN